MGNGSSDDTEALQRCLDQAPGVINFYGGLYKTGPLWITKPLVININGARMIGMSWSIFGVRKVLPYLYIRDMRCEFPNAPDGVSSVHAFGNHDRVDKNDTKGFGYSDAHDYRIDHFEMTGGVIDGGKVCVVDAGGSAHIRGVHFRHSRPGKIQAPYWLCLEHEGYDRGGEIPDKNGAVYVSECDFAVHPPDGWNQDIVKITGSIADAKVIGNTIRNLNPEALAQVDVFTGLHKLIFSANTMDNVQYHRKRMGDAPGNQRVAELDVINGNTFTLLAKHLAHPAIHYIGDRTAITGNTFELIGNSGVSAVWFDNAASRGDLGLGTDATALPTVTGNIADLRRAPNSHMFAFDGQKFGRAPFGHTFTGNIAFKGKGLFNNAGVVEQMVEVGNNWIS